jgi:hypothetical protein
MDQLQAGGLIGLSPQITRVGSTKYPPFLTSLKDQGLIPEEVFAMDLGRRD